MKTLEHENSKGIFKMPVSLNKTRMSVYTSVCPSVTRMAFQLLLQPSPKLSGEKLEQDGSGRGSRGRRGQDGQLEEHEQREVLGA